jgi:hypothetical protein
MTTATLAAPDHAMAPPYFGESAATGTTTQAQIAMTIRPLASAPILMALVLLDHQPASAALIVGGFGLGVAFLKAEFSYTASGSSRAERRAVFSAA